MALGQHQEQSGHRWKNNPIIHNIKVLDKKQRYFHRKVLQVVHIKLRGAILNHNDRYYLPELYLLLLREHTTDHCTASALTFLWSKASFPDDDIPMEVKILDVISIIIAVIRII